LCVPLSRLLTLHFSMRSDVQVFFACLDRRSLAVMCPACHRGMCAWPPAFQAFSRVWTAGRLRSCVRPVIAACVDGPRLARTFRVSGPQVACGHVSGLSSRHVWMAPGSQGLFACLDRQTVEVLSRSRLRCLLRL